MPWRGPRFKGEMPTLGPIVLDWMVENLAAPDRADYEPFYPTREQAQFLWNFYAVSPTTGKRLYRRGVYSRPKGAGKSPLLSAISAAEGLAPVVPDGWDADGEPVARPWSSIRTPLVQIAAVSEDQTMNAYAPLLEMLRNGPVIDNYPGLTPMLSFVALPSGKIEFVTSSATSREGNRPVFCVLDQALAVDTPIPMPSGWTTMGAVRVGDTLVGLDGPVRVTEAKPVSTEHDCYRVTFADRTSLVASEGHLWQTRVAGSAAKARIRTTGQMYADGRRFRVPAAVAHEAPELDLPVPPYLLGYWLGNGTRAKCELSVSDVDLADVRGHLAAMGVETHVRRYASTGGYGGSGSECVNLSFSGASGYQGSERPEVAKAIRKLDCFESKHVPEAYLRGSIAQRTELVRGLMDSDGHCTREGCCTFVNTNRALVGALVELLRSLGQTTSGAKWVVDCRYTGGGKYRVDFTPRGGLVPFALPRKADRVGPRRQQPGDWVSVDSIEPVDRVPVRCIAVDSEDHLFAAGEGRHFTHNTESWDQANGGIRLAQTLRRNLGKTSGSSIEAPNAYVPGSGSVAEQSAEYAQAIREGGTRESGLLWDHREAPPGTDLEDPVSLRKGLVYAYGDAAIEAGGWVDVDRIMHEIWDPSTPPETSRQYFLNQITSASDAWLTQPQWAGCLDVGKIVADRDVITMGFDGSRKRVHSTTDATALIGCRVADGHLFELGVWEEPTGPAAKTWEVPTVAVEAAVKSAFDQFKVIGFYADPARWEGFVSQWEARYADRLKVQVSAAHPCEWWMTGGRAQQTVRVLEEFHTAVLERELTHDGSGALTRHILNCRRRHGRAGMQIAKEFPESPNKIDGAVAAVLAWRARLDAVAGGHAIAEPRRAAPKRIR